MRLYTRTGDRGTTGLVGGERRAKSDLRIQCIGEVDELNAWLGLLRATIKGAENLDRMCRDAQAELFELGAELASPGRPPRLSADQVTEVERWIDLLDEQLPALKSFVLPGGGLPASHAHVARAVCRRAERSINALLEREPPVGEQETFGPRYLNRLSDWLFVVARTLARNEGEETPWLPRQ